MPENRHRLGFVEGIHGNVARQGVYLCSSSSMINFEALRLHYEALNGINNTIVSRERETFFVGRVTVVRMEVGSRSPRCKGDGSAFQRKSRNNSVEYLKS